jgi:soluble lytic murein transglycosylase-like protein/outer membrane protein assembly factor BamD (BamD/ComL family)
VQVWVGGVPRHGLALIAVVLLAASVACGHRMTPQAPIAVTPAYDGDAGTRASTATTIGAAQAVMLKALTGMRAGRAAEMCPLWRRALVEYPGLRDYHLYYLGIAEASAGHVDVARREFDTLLREESDSVLVPYAAFRLGCLLARTERQTAIGHLRAARTDLPKGSREWAKASLLLAQLEIQEGRTGSAWRLLGDVRRRVGPGVARRRARRAARRLAAASPETASRPPRVAEEARLLLREGSAVEADRLLVAALGARPSARFRPGLLSLLGTAQYEEGRLDQAEDTMRSLLAEYPSHALAPSALLALARWRWNRDDDALALERFSEFVRRYPGHSDVPEALHAIGRIYQGAGRFAEAQSAYKTLERRFPKTELAEDARWRQGWLEYIRGHYRAAADAFGRLAPATDRASLGERALYWQARAAERSQGAAAGLPLFTSVIVNFPFGYYAVWAEEWIAKRAPGLEAAGAALGVQPGVADEADEAVLRRGRSVICNPQDSPRPLALLASEPGASVLSPKRFRRAVDLAAMGLTMLARRELDAIEFPPASRVDAQLVLLEAYTRVGAYHRALLLSTLARPRAPWAIGDPMDRFRYPLAYWELIQEYAAAHDLDPYLAMAVIRQESGFDPRAVSSKGARGLMQLMPKTAVDIAGNVGLPPPGESDLDRPDVNVQLGTAYLGQLLGVYGGAVHKALAAYNAGEDAVAKWDRRFSGAAPDEFIEEITYPETQGYVKAVMRNHRIYRSLCGEVLAVPGLPSQGKHERSEDAAEAGDAPGRGMGDDTEALH